MKTVIHPFLLLLGVSSFCLWSGNLFGKKLNQLLRDGTGRVLEVKKIRNEQGDPSWLNAGTVPYGKSNESSSLVPVVVTFGDKFVASSDMPLESPPPPPPPPSSGSDPQPVLEAEEDEEKEEEQQQQLLPDEPQTTTTTTTTMTPTFPPKADPNQPTIYIEYMSKWGWSNQALYCAQKAYYVAKATDAVFVTAPVLSHFFGMGYNLWEAQQSGVYPPHNLTWAYIDRLPQHEYVRLDQVLDMEYTFPGVTIMDYRDFVLARKTTQDATFSTWLMESQYSPSNTVYTKGRPDVEGKPIREGINPPQYHDLQLIQQQRLEKAMASGDHRDQIWTLLNAFFTVLHPSVMKDESPGGHDGFRIRYSDQIRKTAHQIQKQTWKNIPYLALHLRFSDGEFRRDLNKLETTVNAIQKSRKLITQWIKQQEQERGVVLNGQQEMQQEVGIFIATDLPDGQKQMVAGFMELHMMDFWENNKVKVVVKDSSSFQNYTDQLQPTLLYAGIFLDQHLAACGSIGFVGVQGSSFSTFSQMIDVIRQSPGACD